MNSTGTYFFGPVFSQQEN